MDYESMQKLLAAHAGHKWGRFLPYVVVLQAAFDAWVILHGKF